MFKFWKESDPDSIIARIDKEWDPRNGDPNLGNPIVGSMLCRAKKFYADHRMRYPKLEQVGAPDRFRSS